MLHRANQRWLIIFSKHHVTAWAANTESDFGVGALLIKIILRRLFSSLVHDWFSLLNDWHAVIRTCSKFICRHRSRTGLTFVRYLRHTQRTTKWLTRSIICISEEEEDDGRIIPKSNAQGDESLSSRRCPRKPHRGFGFNQLGTVLLLPSPCCHSIFSQCAKGQCRISQLRHESRHE